MKYLIVVLMILFALPTQADDRLKTVETKLSLLTRDVAFIEDFDDGNGEWSDEFQRFQDSGKRHLILGARSYVTKPVRFTRTVVIEGQGRATEIHAYPVHGTTFTLEYPGSQDSRIRGLTVRGIGLLVGTEAVGIRSQARVLLEDVIVTGPYKHGVEIHASVQAKSVTNANLWTLNRVHVHYSQHAGIFVHGNDANAGLALQTDTIHVCTHASKYVDMPSCAGQVFSDFLGSTVIAAHTSNSNGHRGYRINAASGRGVCLGCYLESNQQPGLLSQNAIAIGGMWGPGPWHGGLSIGPTGRLWNATLVAPTIETSPWDADPTPRLMRWQTWGATIRAEIEAFQGGWRGSDRGTNSRTGWDWFVGGATFRPRVQAR